MSILNTKPNKIAPMKLRARGFDMIRWGSPLHWKDHNAKVYEWYGSFDDEWDNWSIVFFPKKFEGRATPGLTYAVDMRGRAMMHKDSSGHPDYFVSPILNTMEDLDIFIEQVLSDNYPEVHEMIKLGDLKYA